MGKIKKTIKNELRRRQQNKCFCCGTDSSLEAHHILPRSKGGKSTLDNLVLLCPFCHREVHIRIDILKPQTKTEYYNIVVELRREFAEMKEWYRKMRNELIDLSFVKKHALLNETRKSLKKW